MDLIYQKARYSVDDTLAILTYTEDPETGLEPWGYATVNVSAYYHFPLTDDLVILPKYKMTKEFYETVVNDIVEKELSEVQVGYGVAQMVRLKPDWEQHVRMLPEEEYN